MSKRNEYLFYGHRYRRLCIRFNVGNRILWESSDNDEWADFLEALSAHCQEHGRFNLTVGWEVR